MAYCLGAGTVIALLAWVVLLLMPRQDARIRFALWFYVFVAIAVLPMVATLWKFGSATNAHLDNEAARSVITLRQSWAVYIFLGWAAFASVALLRMVLAL